MLIGRAGADSYSPRPPRSERRLERSVLKFAGMKPVRETLSGMVNAASDAKRRGWLDRKRDYGLRLV